MTNVANIAHVFDIGHSKMMYDFKYRICLSLAINIKINLNCDVDLVPCLAILLISPNWKIFIKHIFYLVMTV